MADSQRRALLTIELKSKGADRAAADIESISTVAAKLNGDLSTLERSDVLKELGATAARAAVSTGDLDKALMALSSELEKVGASEKEIRKVSKEFDRTTASIQKARATQEKLGAAMAKDAEKAAAATKTVAKEVVTLDSALGKIGRADEITQLATKWGNVAKKTKDVTTATAQLTAELKRMNATEDEIQGAASAFTGAQQGGKNALARIGSEIRQLPSQRVSVAGTEIGTDSLGNFARLAGAAQEAFKDLPGTLKAAGLATGILKQAQDAATIAEGSKTAATVGSSVATNTHTAANTTLAVSEGAATAGAVSLNIALAPIAAVGLAAAAAIATVVAVLSAAQAQTAEQTKKIAESFEAKAAVDEFVRSGATTEDAYKRLAELQGVVTDATNLRSEAEAKAAEDFKNRAGGPFGEFAARLGDLLNVKSLDEGFKPAIESTTQAIAEATPELEELKLGLESGAFAANDAALAEEELAKVRTDNALRTADSIGKQMAAEDRSLSASEQQNRDRLKSISDEKEILEAQITSLEKSGVVSEDVTTKIAALKDSLGQLGKETEFINTVGLEASRANDARIKSEKDTEDAAKKAQSAQDQYNKSVQSAATTLKNSAQDIGTRLKQTLVDNTTKLNRDLDNIATKHNRDEYNLTVKSNRAERDAQQEQIRDLSKIRDDALKDEQSALKSGDFRALFEAREKSAEAIKNQREDISVERAHRQQATADAREDLDRAFRQQNEDRRLGYTQQSADARISQARELQQARLTQQRALAVASEGMNAELKMRANFWNAAIKQTQTALNQLSGLQAGANPQQARTNTNNAFAQSFTTAVRK